MPETAWKYPGTVVDNGGNYAWVNPNNVKVDDETFATERITGKNTTGNILLLTNFGFSSSDIPAGSTINGIEFIISRKAGQPGYLYDYSIYLRNSGGNTGSNMASAATYDTTLTPITYGGATNMCGTSLTQSDIVASSFGIAFLIAIGSSTNYTAYVDYIKIRVYYTEGGASVKPYYYYLNQ